MIIYGRNAVAEALRGKRRVRRIWAVKGDWEGAPVTQASPADITARCGSDAHQGVCADVEEYRYTDGAALLARPDPFLVALDEVTDPQNLGAIARTAECAGATGIVIPERRSAEVTPAAVAMGVRRLLVSPSFWANAARLRRELAGLPAPDEVLAGLLGAAADAA